jgi:hypothetical protein
VRSALRYSLPRARGDFFPIQAKQGNFLKIFSEMNGGISSPVRLINDAAA